jgi:uroporphyrinogen III methyltransferase/synthase
MTKIRIITKEDRLSLAQVREVEQVFATSELDFRSILSACEQVDEDEWRTANSRQKICKEFHDALENGNADVFISSAMYLPYPLSEELEVYALLPSSEQSDVIITNIASGLSSLPYGALVGANSKIRREGLLQQRSDIRFTSLSSNIEDSINKLKNGEVDAIVEPEINIRMAGFEKNIKEVLSIKTHPLQGYLAVVGKKGNHEFKQLFEVKDIRKKWGKVVLAGFGPGDQWLITKKAEYNLQRAEVIFYDDLVNEEYIKQFCTQKIYVGKRKGQHKYDQEKINELLYRTAKEGKRVVRIKGGDPLIFGRGAEEYHYLSSRFIKSEIIPGITSAFAAAASSVIPLTERSLSSSVVFLSGHDLNKLRVPQADTLVFYMGASHQKELAQKIIGEGWHENTPVGIIYNASNPQQKVYRGTLKLLAEKGSGLPSPSIIIVGKTAQQYNEQSQKWLYTGLSVNDWEHDEHIVHTPLICIEPYKVNDDIASVFANIESYNRIVFTNKYCVQHFFEMLLDSGKDLRALSHLSIDSIGENTSKALRKKGILAKPFTDVESSSAMLSYYKEVKIKGEHILIPGSNHGLKVLPEGLRELGNNVHCLAIYEIHKNKAIVKQNLDQFYGIVFTSPATILAFIDVYKKIPSHLQIRCRGKQTQKKLDKVISKRLEKKAV